jgi:hypothetical protein
MLTKRSLKLRKNATPMQRNTDDLAARIADLNRETSRFNYLQQQHDMLAAMPETGYAKGGVVNNPANYSLGAADTRPQTLDDLKAKYEASRVEQLQDIGNRLEDATPLDRETYRQTGMEPGLERPIMIPRYDSESGWTAPEILYQTAKAAVAPGAAWKGVESSLEEVANVASTFGGEGLVASHIAGPTERGILGMGVKNRGGNWPMHNVESAFQRMRPEGPKNIDEALSYWDDVTLARMADPGSFEAHAIRQNNAMDTFIDKKAIPYVKNDMGTPRDKLRELADTGVSFADENVLNMRDIAKARQNRRLSGYDELGFAKTDAGINYEDITDYGIKNKKAGDYLGKPEYETSKSISGDWKTTDARTGEVLGRGVSRFASEDDATLKRGHTLSLNKWLQKVPPETPVHELRGTVVENLGFPHIMDQLYAATSYESYMPSDLVINPDRLGKMSLEDAVKHVKKIDSWQAEEAARADLARTKELLESTPRMVDTNLNLSFTEGTGGRWVDLPDANSESGKRMAMDVGKSGGWCTQHEYGASAYGSGSNRLTALFDAEGRPHVQVQIHTPTNTIEQLKPPSNNFDAKGSFAQRHIEKDPEYKEKITESVVDFLNSGDWGNVPEKPGANAIPDIKLFGIKDLKTSSPGYENTGVSRFIKDPDVWGSSSRKWGADDRPDTRRLTPGVGMYAKGGHVRVTSTEKQDLINALTNRKQHA